MGILQDRIRDTLAKSGIAHKTIECYGSQIVVTSWSRKAADDWASLISSFAVVRGVTESVDEKHDAKPGTPVSKKYVRVFRTFARIAA